MFARIVAVCALALLLAASSTVRTAQREIAAPPGLLHGSWRGACGADAADAIDIAVHGVLLASAASRLACRPTGLRTLGPARWYLDLACPDSGVVLLDLYLIAPDRMLVAHRPLGKACGYSRVGTAR